jgi:hypothetical protein
VQLSDIGRRALAHGPDCGLRPPSPLGSRPRTRPQPRRSVWRYGPLHLIHYGPGKYDWAFLDEVATEMQRLGIVPIMDLCRFGLPDWLQNFQNPQVPHALADYARVFARRYPWVRLYILVNEMHVFAKPSALDGLWNEQCRDERARSPATCSGRVKGRDTASVIIFQIDVPGEHPLARQRRCEPRRGPSTRV